MSVTGEPDGEPMKSAVAVADLFTGMYAVTAILAALRHAERTGEGQHIDIVAARLPSRDAGQSWRELSCCLAQAPKRVGNHHASIAPYEVLATATATSCLRLAMTASSAPSARSPASRSRTTDRFANNDDRVINRSDAHATRLAPSCVNAPRMTGSPRLKRRAFRAGRSIRSTASVRGSARACARRCGNGDAQRTALSSVSPPIPPHEQDPARDAHQRRRSWAEILMTFCRTLLDADETELRRLREARRDLTHVIAAIRSEQGAGTRRLGRLSSSKE